MDRLEELQRLWHRMDLMMQEDQAALLFHAVDSWTSSDFTPHDLRGWAYGFEAELSRRVCALSRTFEGLGDEDEGDPSEKSQPFPALPEDFLRFWREGLSVAARMHYCEQELQLVRDTAGIDQLRRLEALHGVIESLVAEAVK